MTAIRADSAAWLPTRCGLATASRMNDVLDIRKDGKPGAGRKRYMAELVSERITGQVSDHPVTGPMLRGREQQPHACAAYEAATGQIVGPEMFVTHPTIEFAGATPDGTIDDDGLVEFKVPLTHNFVDWVLDGGVPEQHIAQLTWQLACTRRKWVDFCAYCPEFPGVAGLHIVRYQPTDAQIADLEAKVREFLKQVDAAFVAITTRTAA
jgi:YqaJ-like viral recombinase domain